ncbi:uncharacterized protein LOC117103110 isoform X2 [Anneissia japonica]|uniref:uncharacterized protein LOC117103110 isoform X2 n=1 Tax=Anneissia japonica TaxID=1529436 RepID=UPI0014255D66|nr:uncharacterized protein LOC117103110 isoform X2 [Anneissia japonica]
MPEQVMSTTRSCVSSWEDKPPLGEQLLACMRLLQHETLRHQTLHPATSLCVLCLDSSDSTYSWTTKQNAPRNTTTKLKCSKIHKKRSDSVMEKLIQFYMVAAPRNSVF